MDVTVSLPVRAGDVSIPVSWGQIKQKPLPETCYRKGRKTSVMQIVLHHDATFSSEDAWQILSRRGLSYHFSIDNNGCIYQMVNMANTAWHARGNNHHTIGICLSNAHDLKWASRYEPRRPIERSVVHGVPVHHLGLYDVQKHACKALVRALAQHYDIPMTTPDSTRMIEGDMIRYGVVAHYHLDRGKIDPIGLDLQEVVA